MEIDVVLRVYTWSNLKGMCNRLKKYLTAFYLKPSLMKI